jgi:PST family polysaccharide transporter
MTTLMSWWYSRKVPPARRSDFPTSSVRIGTETVALLKLGLAFTVSGAITLGVGYAVRIVILERIGFAATGLYQSAWTLGGLYVGFILQAMGADFYPRLSGSAEDITECNRLVNEQSHVGILLGGPGVLASISLAPLVMSVFYSRSFADAVPILRWICLGAMLQVISWPMGFIIIAKAKRLLFVLCEVAWGIVSIGLAWICIAHFGLVGTGIAFFGSYVFHAGMLYVVAGRLSGFRWSKHSRSAGLVSLSMTAAVFCGFYLLPPRLSVTFGFLATILHLIYSVRSLTRLFSSEEIPRPILKILASCRWIFAGMQGKSIL